MCKNSIKRTVFGFALTLTLITISAIFVEVLCQSNDSASPLGSNDSVRVSTRFAGSIAKEKLVPIKPTFFADQPVIDGILDDAVWRSAVVLEDFYQVSPGDNSPPSKPTKVRLGYDRDNLFVSFHCYDEREGVRASLAKRDDIFGEDNVRIFLDTFNDRQTAFLLAFNPLGIQQDGIYIEPAIVDFSVDISMESKGTLTSDGWSVEIRIPFTSLRYSSGKPIVWGIHLVRYISRLNNESTSWMPFDRNNGTWLSQSGKLTGLDGIRFERVLEISPTVSVSQTGSRIATFPSSTGIFVDGPVKPLVGANLKALIAPGAVLDLAVNPDYAEVEADVPVITENQRFPLFFEERRPFFLEGLDLFQTPLQLFHSRKIVDPSVAAKLTFRGRDVKAGLVASLDDAPGNYGVNELVNPSDKIRANEFIGKRALSIVARGKLNHGLENYTGGFASLRFFPEDRNGVIGFDGKNTFKSSLTLQYQVALTHSRRCFFEPEFEPLINSEQAERNRRICQTGVDPLNADPHSRYRSGGGFGYYLSLDRTRRNSGWYLEVAGRTNDYRAALGVDRRTNTNRIFFTNRISTEAKPRSSLVRIDWRQFSAFSFDFEGRSQSSSIGTNLTFNLQRNTRLSSEVGLGYERLVEEEFGLKRMPTRVRGAFFGAPERSAVQRWAEVRFTSQPTKRLRLEGYLHQTWGLFDLDKGAGPRFPRVSPAALTQSNSALDPGPGGNTRVGLRIDFIPVDRLRVTANFQNSKLIRRDNGRLAFDTHIVSLSSIYHFSRFTFLRSRWDYGSSTGTLSGEVLIAWIPKPGRALYVGYNNRLNYNGFNPFTMNLEPGIRTNNRTFFVRLSHQFRWKL